MRDCTFLRLSRQLGSSQIAVGTARGELLLYDRLSRCVWVAAAKHKKKLTCGDWNSQGQFAFASEDRQISIVSTAVVVTPATTDAAAGIVAVDGATVSSSEQQQRILQQQQQQYGKTFGQVKVKSRPTNVKFGGGSGSGSGAVESASAAAGASGSSISNSSSSGLPSSSSPRAPDAIVSVSMDRKTILLYNLSDPENALELAFQSRYGCIVSFKWFGEGMILVAFSFGFIVVISTDMQQIGREQFCARFFHKGGLRDVAVDYSSDSGRGKGGGGRGRVAMVGAGDGGNNAAGTAAAAGGANSAAAGASAAASSTSNSSHTGAAIKIVEMKEWTEIMHEELDLSSPSSAAVPSSSGVAAASSSSSSSSSSRSSSVNFSSSSFCSASSVSSKDQTAVLLSSVDKLGWSPNGDFLACSTRAGHLIVYSVEEEPSSTVTAGGAASGGRSRAGSGANGAKGGTNSSTAGDATALRLAKRRRRELELANPNAPLLQRLLHQPFTLLSALACAGAVAASATLALSSASGVSLGEMWRMAHGCSSF